MICWPPPLTMITFSIIQIVIFFISARCNGCVLLLFLFTMRFAIISMYDNNMLFGFYSKGEFIFTIENNNTVASVLEYDPCNPTQIWTFISYMFIHSNVTHLLSNLIMQICFGVPLELVNHWSRVTLIYLAGVLAGSIAHSMFGNSYLHGASAGVYALIVAHVATVIIVNIHFGFYSSRNLLFN